MTINTKLPLKACWKMVNRIHTIENCETAIKWLKANEVITTDQFDELMMAVSSQYREIRRAERFGY